MTTFLNQVKDVLLALKPGVFPYGRFSLALLIGACGGYLFVLGSFPLPWMMGSMVACTIAALLKVPVAAPPFIRPPMSMVIGVMMGSSFSPDLIMQIPRWWPATLGLMAFMIACGTTVVWYFHKIGGFDRTTAFFAGMPGGLVEMVETGEEKGGDARTIALVHSVRILLIVMTLPFAIRWMEGISLTRTGGSVSMFDAPFSAEMLLLGCGIGGIILGRLLRLPASNLIGPMVFSAGIHMAGLTDFKPPFEIVNTAQLILGIVIGCRFVGTAAATVLRIIVLSLGSTAILLFWTVSFAVLIAKITGFQVVTVLLAFSPGGLAEMSLIALALHAEVAFVAAHHIIRIILVMLMAAPVFAMTKGD